MTERNTDLLVFHGSYPKYFIARTLEQRAHAFYTVLKERMEDGWFEAPEAFDASGVISPSDNALLLLTQAQIDAMPATQRQRTIDERERAQSNYDIEKELYDEDNAWYHEVLALVKLEETEAIKQLTPNGKQSRLEALAKEHQGNEDEGYSFEHLG
jgi:hypothetical protein